MMTHEELFEKFKEEWERASAISPNLAWAIFPVGSPELELETAKEVLKTFTSVSGILFSADNVPHEDIVAWAKLIQEQYEEKAKYSLEQAAEETGYELHLGS